MASQLRLVALPSAAEDSIGPRSGAAYRLFDAAKTLFARKGYEATTTRQIAKEAGLTVGTIYKHYESKEVILDAIVVAAANRLEPVLQAEIERGAERLLYRLTYRLVEFNLSFPRESRIANEDYRSLSGPCLEAAIAHRRAIRRMFEDAFPQMDEGTSDERRAQLKVLAATLIVMATAPKDWWHPESRYDATQTSHLYGAIAEQFALLDTDSFNAPPLAALVLIDAASYGS